MELITRRCIQEMEGDDLSTRYANELEKNPDLGWEEFIVQTAIAEP